MTTKAENEKIAQAMSGQASARRARRQTTKERLTSQPPTIPVESLDGEDPAGLVDVTTGAPIVPESPKRGRKATVLEDPIANAKLIRMRAKWAAIREERRAAKVEAKGEQSKEAKQARSKVERAWAEERKAYAAYRKLLDASKQASRPAETAQAEA